MRVKERLPARADAVNSRNDNYQVDFELPTPEEVAAAIREGERRLFEAIQEQERQRPPLNPLKRHTPITI